MGGSPRISGAIACAVLGAIKDRLGPERHDLFRARLPPAARESCEAATAIDWVDLQHFNLVYGAAAAVLNASVQELATELARESVVRTLNTVWKILLRFTTDSALSTRAPLLYAKTFDTGHAQSVFEGERRTRVTVTAWPTMPDLSVLTLGVGIETVLKAAGRAQAHVVARRTADGVEYLGAW